MSEGLALPWGILPKNEVEGNDMNEIPAYPAEGLTAGEHIEVS